MSSARLAAAALGLVGTRFRLHGRDPAQGLDCIGLLECAMALIGRPIVLPQGYSLRLSNFAGWLPELGPLGFADASGPIVPGDVLLYAPGPAQAHLAIAASSSSHIHAHAGLRRVVLTPGLPDYPLHHWRLLASTD